MKHFRTQYKNNSLPIKLTNEATIPLSFHEALYHNNIMACTVNKIVAPYKRNLILLAKHIPWKRFSIKTAFDYIENHHTNQVITIQIILNMNSQSPVNANHVHIYNIANKTILGVIITFLVN